MTYPWEAYVTIDRGITESERAAAIASMNQIWNFHDGEGQALIRAAFAQNHNRAINIEMDTQEYGSGVFTRNVGGQDIDSIRLNFRNEIARTVEEGGLDIRASLTSTLVHELYHVADDPKDIERAAENTLLQLAGVERDSVKGRRLLSAIDRMAAEDGQDRTQTIITAALSPGYLLGMGADGLATVIGIVPSTERVQRLRDAGVISREQPTAQIIEIGNAIPRSEEDATDYTDALLQKNTPDEPLRATYANSDILDRMPRGYATYRQSPTPAESAGFAAAEYHLTGLGDIEPPPQVRPVPPSQERERQ